MLKSTEKISVDSTYSLGNLAQLYQRYKTPILYSGGSVAKAFAQMIVGFVIAKYIAPDDFGLWNSINLALTYSLLAQSGLINGLNRELPYLFGKGENREALLMAGTVQTFTVFSCLAAIVVGGIALFFLPVKDPKLVYGIVAVIIMIVFNYYQSYLFSTFRSKDSFLNLSKIQFLHAFTNIITILLVVYFSYYGMIVKAVIVSFVYLLLLHLKRPIKVGLRWDKQAFIKLVKVGLPIFSLAYIESIATTADRLWLLKYSSLSKIGLYSFAFYALTSFTIFPQSIASYIYPKMTFDYGKTNDKLIMWRYVKKITIVLLAVLVPMAIIGYLLCPLIIERFFPAYSLSAPIMQILLLAGVFSGSVIGVNALWSMKTWKYMVIYQLTFSLLLFVMPYIGLQLCHDRLYGVAYGVLAAHIINFFSGIGITYLATHENPK